MCISIKTALLNKIQSKRNKPL